MSAGARPAPGDNELPGLGDIAGPAAGRVEVAVRRSLVGAALDARDEGAGELAASLARAVDLAHNRKDPYAVASCARELRETLLRLRLDPQSRVGADAGGIDAFLAGLTQAEGGAPAPEQPRQDGAS